MPDLLVSLARLLGARRDAAARDVTQPLSRTFRCRCGAHVFFDNTLCLRCGAPLGYLPEARRVVPLAPEAAPDATPQDAPAAGDNAAPAATAPRSNAPAVPLTATPPASATPSATATAPVTNAPAPGAPDRWRADDSDVPLKFCANRDTPALCNWLLPADDPQSLCVACRLNRTIPDLSDADNARYWGLIEAAKRRLVSQLLALDLPVRARQHEDPGHGLMFDFLRAAPGGPAVMTGHADGLITINVEEADDARRESIRHAMHEPYRTLLGHFRHEVGHYYWDRLVRDTRWHEPFRALFGDERADYAAALRANYEQGPPADWADRFVSAYASTHPWEDWAETWAHYLHVLDSLGTALGFGLNAEDLESRIEPFGPDALYAPDDPGAERFLALLNSWIEVTMVLNEMARSLGQRDFYPFVISRPVVAKLQFVHLVVRDAAAAQP